MKDVARRFDRFRWVRGFGIMCGMKKVPKKQCEGKSAVEVVETVETELYAKVRGYIARARAKVYAVANTEMVVAYWNVGREDVSKTLHAV